METIPTAEEFLTLRVEHYKKIGKGGVTTAMIEFAKLHVTEALRQASEKAVLLQDGSSKRSVPTGSGFKSTYAYVPIYKINRSSILNAYLLDNIK